MNDADAAIVEPTPRARWPVFAAGFLLGAGVAVGSLLAFLELRKNPAAAARNSEGVLSNQPVKLDSTPGVNEVLDYLDGKTFTAPTKKDAKSPTPFVIRKSDLSEMRWHSGSQISGSENPWRNGYSCLYSHEKGDFILDFTVLTRVIGTRRAFLDVEFRQVTPVEKLVTPSK